MRDELILEAGSVAAILPAAGISRRFGGEEKKIFARLAGRPVWFHAAQRLRACAEVGQMIIVVDQGDRHRWQHEFGELLKQLRVDIVDGGSERYDSVRNGIDAVGDAAFIAVHDAARPLVPHADLRALWEAARDHDAVMLASPVRGTIKRANAERGVVETVDRRGLWEALTPQLFRRDLLVAAYDHWRGWPITDDASLVERSGGCVVLVPGSSLNLKITEPADLQIAEAILAAVG